MFPRPPPGFRPDAVSGPDGLDEQRDRLGDRSAAYAVAPPERTGEVELAREHPATRPRAGDQHPADRLAVLRVGAGDPGRGHAVGRTEKQQ